MEPISFFVPGKPEPGGSKKAMHHNKSGKIIVMDDAKQGRRWRDRVTSLAMDLHPGTPLDGPLAVRFVFVVSRPKGHYRTGRNAHLLRDDAPASPTTKPDVLKLARSTEDALTGILWVDDAQTVHLELIKQYGDRPGVHVAVRRSGEGGGS